jgi:hypothetical protein
VAAERAGEHLVTAEPLSDRDVEHGIVVSGQPRGRALEADSKRVLLRGLADDSTEGAMEVKGRPACT